MALQQQAATVRRSAAFQSGTCIRCVLRGVAISALLLVPCFWQARIQAGDLSSHVYNAWLAGEIQKGHLPGLTVVSQLTNVTFDLMLGGLLGPFGVGAAQRIAVSAAVLVFFWGAFALISVASRRSAWPVAPLLGMLAYGWVFHMGLFNFYLSVGFSLGALALLWNGPRRSAAWAIPLLVFALSAHAFLFLWAICMAGYVWFARICKPENRWRLLTAGVLILLAIRWFVKAQFPARHSWVQILWTTGMDQLLVFTKSYVVFWAAGLILLFLMWRDVRKRMGYRGIVLEPAFQAYVLTAAGVVLLPAAVFLPGYGHGLMFIDQRMSLPVAVMLCCVVAQAKVSKPRLVAGILIAGLFFVFLYRDEAHANAAESRIETALATIPSGSRVISSFRSERSRVEILAHAIDRVCISKCFSYANYEPSTRQFRVRVKSPNPFVVPQYADSDAIQRGTYIVKASDLPLYQVEWCDQAQKTVCVRDLKAGQENGAR
jgi:hypothetical protein